MLLVSACNVLCFRHRCQWCTYHEAEPGSDESQDEREGGEGGGCDVFEQPEAVVHDVVSRRDQGGNATREATKSGLSNAPRRTCRLICCLRTPSLSGATCFDHLLIPIFRSQTCILLETFSKKVELADVSSFYEEEC